MIQFDKEIIIAIVSALIIGCGVYYLVNKRTIKTTVVFLLIITLLILGGLQ